MVRASTTLQLSKQGAGGDSSDDRRFERSFAALAHTFIREKAPSLLDYEQGFQLLDRNDDGTRAVGVSGFRVGNTQLLVPFFFIHGQVKGSDVLFNKTDNRFLPLKENWLNYIINRRLMAIGRRVPRNGAGMGVMYPDMTRLSRPPAKYAAVGGSAHQYVASLPEWVRDFLPLYAALTDNGGARWVKQAAADYAAAADALNLETFLKTASAPMVRTLASAVCRYPEFAETFDSLHGLDCLRAAVCRANTDYTHSIMPKAAATRIPVGEKGSILQPRHPIKTGALRIITFDLTAQTALPHDITDDERETLLRDSMVVRDRRKTEEVSIPFNLQVGEKLFNPTESGLYEILTKPGTFERCYVAMYPHGDMGRANFCTVVSLDGESRRDAWVNASPSVIFAGSRIEGKDYDDWYAALPGADDLTPQRGEIYMLVGPRDDATMMFSVDEDLGEAYGSRSYGATFSSYVSPEYRGSAADPNSYPATAMTTSSYKYRPNGMSIIHLASKGGTALRSEEGDLWIPRGYKYLRCDNSYGGSSFAAQSGTGPFALFHGGSKKRPLRPGHIMTAQLHLIMNHRTKSGSFEPGTKKDAEAFIRAKTATLKLYHTGTECQIGNRRMTPRDALIELVASHGLREDAARHILKEAQLRRSYTFRIKYADPYMTDQGPTSPVIPEPEPAGDNLMGYPGQTVLPQVLRLPVPDMTAYQTDRNLYNPNPIYDNPAFTPPAGTANGAATQRDVFDASVIGSMLKNTSDDALVDRYLPKLMDAMDAQGRILLSFYAHGDLFADRYGKDKMPELEDALRNTFDSTGDLTFFLKQKSVEPYPEEDNPDTDLDEAASGE